MRRRARLASRRRPRPPAATAASRLRHPDHDSVARDTLDAATAELDPQAGAAALASAFAVADEHGLEAHGIWTVAEQEQGWATDEEGGAERRTDAFMKVICIAPSGRSGYAAQSSVAVGDIDARALAESAARKALADGEPAELPPGEYTVVFEPQAVGWLCDLLAFCVQRPRARGGPRRADGRLGERSRCRRSTWPTHRFTPRTLPRSFDAEGTRSRRCR